MVKKIYRSNIPPQVIASLEEMLEMDRKIRASELLSSYEERATKLEKIGGRMAEEWVIRQSAFLSAVCDELREIVATGDLPERN